MIGKAYALGSGTIVNAIASGKGSAFGLDLKVTAKVKLNQSGKVTGKIIEEPSEDTRLIKNCAKKVLDKFNLTYGAEVETRSEVPIARGLSSSSAAANAVILATLSAIKKEVEPLNIINLGIDAALESKVTITGAFDDACASFFGGVIVTDNLQRKILRKFTMDEELAVILYIPEEKAYTVEKDVGRMKLFSEQVNLAYAEALKKNVYKALTLNGLIYCASLGYSPVPALLALENGALAAGLSGTGPAFTVICQREKAKDVKSALQDLKGEVIITKPNNEGAKILQ